MTGELIADRHLTAPAPRVWTAFTTPAGIAAFWGGSHMLVTEESVSLDPRPGGHFTVAHGPFRFAFNDLFTFRDGLIARIDSYVVPLDTTGAPEPAA